ncbi:hypothetical protein FLK61_36810 [Paenalkalicoccus suaedae]|uniref:Uncharacterized protein n=1 Tax=Paenalkalicoccus suaedae TaxID=2592382 RepID=A0A859FIS8_9BACI|nr:hypothetical protein [Paenalkalicoccus suaedae]QKS72206.1 hypothetical protein FLK61_36810 [Paenalkalicoccus suaedae]
MKTYIVLFSVLIGLLAGCGESTNVEEVQAGEAEFETNSVESETTSSEVVEPTDVVNEEDEVEEIPSGEPAEFVHRDDLFTLSFPDEWDGQFEAFYELKGVTFQTLEGAPLFRVVHVPVEQFEEGMQYLGTSEGLMIGYEALDNEQVDVDAIMESFIYHVVFEAEPLSEQELLTRAQEELGADANIQHVYIGEDHFFAVSLVYPTDPVDMVSEGVLMNTTGDLLESFSGKQLTNGVDDQVLSVRVINTRDSHQLFVLNGHKTYYYTAHLLQEDGLEHLTHFENAGEMFELDWEQDGFTDTLEIEIDTGEFYELTYFNWLRDEKRYELYTGQVS